MTGASDDVASRTPGVDRGAQRLAAHVALIAKNRGDRASDHPADTRVGVECHAQRGHALEIVMVDEVTVNDIVTKALPCP